MSDKIAPAIWLLVLLVGLPQLSETVYSPSLPDIARTLKTSESLVEHTLTIFLFSFALGTLFWGRVSDKFGRKPCILAGFLIFILGCMGCYFSTNITFLMVSRFIQAFGGSVGSALGITTCRDVFTGSALGHAYAAVGSAVPLFPAIGPIIGGFIAQYWEWPSIFLFLTAFTIVLFAIIAYRFPETHRKHERIHTSLKEVSLALMRDKKVIGFCLIIGACNGINFSYFAEGSFCLISILGLSPSHFGISCTGIAMSTMLGAFFTKKLLKSHTSEAILKYGLLIVFWGNVLFTALMLLNAMMPLKNNAIIGITISAQMMARFGIAMIVSTSLTLMLTDYKWCIGTASSLSGFFYYVIMSVFLFFMGCLHDSTLLPMPLYFLGLSVFMLLVNRFLLKE